MCFLLLLFFFFFFGSYSGLGPVIFSSVLEKVMVVSIHSRAPGAVVCVSHVSRFPVSGHEAVVTDEAERMLSRTKELCYLTSFVIRLFEDAEKVTRITQHPAAERNTNKTRQGKIRTFLQQFFFFSCQNSTSGRGGGTCFAMGNHSLPNCKGRFMNK